MNRCCWIAAVVGGAVACASSVPSAPPDPQTSPSVKDEARAACERSAATSPECLDLLTRPEVESREEVEAAEAKRKADAFRGRLAGLRAAVEQRGRTRATKTPTAAVARLLDRQRRPRRAPTTAFALDPAFAGPELEEPDLIAAGLEPPERTAAPTADRSPPSPAKGAETGGPPAQIAAPAGPPPAPPPGRRSPPPKAGRPAGGAGAAPLVLAPGPVPELYLRAGRCLLNADQDGGVTALNAYRRGEGADRTQAGRWALALTDARALADRVEAEIAHRKLAKPGPVCMSSQVQPVVGLLRSLTGPPPTTLTRALEYGRGLQRLDRELQVRAGLPKAE